MRPIGFSTGALAYGDFRRGLELVRREGLVAVELSALREPELEPLMAELDDLDLGGLTYVSVHAPSAFTPGHEARVAEMLRPAADRGWPIVVHPDAIRDPDRWSGFGETLCIENMDKRKGTGRSCAELAQWFERFPDASFCLDLGHARQCDPTMTEAYFLLKTFGDRLRQVHLSEVATSSKHDKLSWGSTRAFQQIANHIPQPVPIILESPVAESELAVEVDHARRALTPRSEERRSQPSRREAAL